MVERAGGSEQMAVCCKATYHTSYIVTYIIHRNIHHSSYHTSILSWQCMVHCLISAAAAAGCLHNAVLPPVQLALVAAHVGVAGGPPRPVRRAPEGRRQAAARTAPPARHVALRVELHASHFHARGLLLRRDLESWRLGAAAAAAARPRVRRSRLTRGRAIQQPVALATAAGAQSAAPPWVRRSRLTRVRVGAPPAILRRQMPRRGGGRRRRLPTAAGSCCGSSVPQSSASGSCCGRGSAAGPP